MNLECGSWTPFEFDNWTKYSETCDQGYQFPYKDMYFFDK